jgi:GT2 family glycosyltransferase
MSSFITLLRQSRRRRLASHHQHAVIAIFLSFQCVSFWCFWIAVEQSSFSSNVTTLSPSWLLEFHHNSNLLVAEAAAETAAAETLFSQQVQTARRTHKITSAAAKSRIVSRVTNNNTLDLVPVATEKHDVDDAGHWCGDWTPRGNLGNPHFDAHSVEPIAPERFPSCGVKNSTKVGSTYEPDPTGLYCHPPLQGGDREKLLHRDPAVLALDLQFRRPAAAAAAAAHHVNSRRSKPRKLDYSIIVPSHNVAEVLNISIPLLCQHTVGTYEIIFVLDQSYDDSLQVLRDILLSDTCIGRDAPGRLIRARVLVQPTSIFETSSDNLGFTLATAATADDDNDDDDDDDGGSSASTAAPLLIEIQADHLVAQTGWNRDMARPILQYGDVFAVGGRCGHNRGPVTPHMEGRCDGSFGSLDAEMQKQYENQLYVVGTTCRGPIIFRSDVLKSLGFLDEVNFHQGDDDHDLFRRALHLGWHVAYRYAHVYSPQNLSPVRETKFNEKTPQDGAKQSHWYSEFRKGLEAEGRQCDPDLPIYAYAKVENIPHYRSLDPLPEGSDLTTLPLSPLPAHVREVVQYS